MPGLNQGHGGGGGFVATATADLDMDSNRILNLDSGSDAAPSLQFDGGSQYGIRRSGNEIVMIQGGSKTYSCSLTGFYPPSGNRSVGLANLPFNGAFLKNYVEFTTEIADPGNGSANTARLYARDNGSGKTQIVAVFATGAVQVIATEP